jgi:glycosyltransferase involved in cell wall biosynthesis
MLPSSMISVLIPTLNSERLLVPTLSALVAGSAEGLLRDVVLVDGGSTDGTEKIADAAGCEFRREPAADESERLKVAASAVRGSWLLILEPGCVLDEGWTREVTKFVESAESSERARFCAAVFRLTIDDYGFPARVKEIAAMARLAVTGRPQPKQGMLIAKRLFLQRGRKARRVVVLRTRVVIPA